MVFWESINHHHPHFQAEPKTLIFVETKRKADDLTFQMRKGGWPALCIHGDKSQSERDWVMKGRSKGLMSPLHDNHLFQNSARDASRFCWPPTSLREDWVC